MSAASRLNSRATNLEIANSVELTEGAVRNRIRRLVLEGVIRRFTIETKVPGAEAVVLIQTHTRGSKEVLRRIRKHTDRMFETAGEYDVAVQLTANSITEINQKVDRLRKVEGVISTVTLLKIADDELQ